jgi:hypothetical protein
VLPYPHQPDARPRKGKKSAGQTAAGKNAKIGGKFNRA